MIWPFFPKKLIAKKSAALGRLDAGYHLDTVEHRQVWLKERLLLETTGHKNSISRSGSWVSWAMKMFEWGLQATGAEPA